MSSTNTKMRVDVGTLAERPVSGKRKGQQFAATDTRLLYTWTGTQWDGGVSVATPSSYPYTTNDADDQIDVDSSIARSILLSAGNTRLWQVIADVGDNASAATITVGLEDATKTLNGVLNGTVDITDDGAMRGFYRDTDGNWHGGV
jgi:hypothetical protein